MGLFERVEYGAGSPRVLITAGVHGDEFEPMSTVRSLISALAEERLRGTVILVPVVNESAFRLGERCGEDGLDLARTCPGRPDGSITERVASEVAGLIRTADYYVDLHTGGTRLDVWPLAGYTLHPDEQVLEQQRWMARSMGLPFLWGTDPNLPGRTLSIARQANIPAIYTEYRGTLREGCLNQLAGLGVLERPFRQHPAAIVVEDSTSGSGHMQVCHPVPMDGFWTPAARLGTLIGKGELIGVVTDLLGRVSREVRAERDGLVLVVRTCPSVRAGDSAGVVVELPPDAEIQRFNVEVPDPNLST